MDAAAVAGRGGSHRSTAGGAAHACRSLLESMNEGALTLTPGEKVIYANGCFARMVKCPLEEVRGGSFGRFLSVADRAALQALLNRTAPAGARLQLHLLAADGTQLPVQVCIRTLTGPGAGRATIGVIVTDLTEARRKEEMLRALTRRVIQVQEAERGRIAVELHDNVTQLLCAILFSSHALADEISPHNPSAKKAAMALRAMLGRTATEVERISKNLRPGMLEQLGLVEVLQDAVKEFAARARVAVKLNCAGVAERLPADTELTLYRILQEALANVQQHARAGRVSVSLVQDGAGVELTVQDDGIGFDWKRGGALWKRQAGLGLLGMRERASYLGGGFEIKSAPGTGTEIKVRIPAQDRGGASG